MASLILAQDKRWRRALNMQVGRVLSGTSGGRLSSTYPTCPVVGDSRPNGRVIPHTTVASHGAAVKPSGFEEGLAAYQLVGGVTAHQGDDG